MITWKKFKEDTIRNMFVCPFVVAFLTPWMLFGVGIRFPDQYIIWALSGFAIQIPMNYAMLWYIRQINKRIKYLNKFD